MRARSLIPALVGLVVLAGAPVAWSQSAPPRTSAPAIQAAPQPPAPRSEPRAAPAEAKDRDAALHEALLAESDRKAGLSAFEGFGSFS